MTYGPFEQHLDKIELPEEFLDMSSPEELTEETKEAVESDHQTLPNDIFARSEKENADQKTTVASYQSEAIATLPADEP